MIIKDEGEWSQESTNKSMNSFIFASYGPQEAESELLDEGISSQEHGEPELIQQWYVRYFLSLT